MKKVRVLVLSLVLVLALTATGTAFAQEGTEPPPVPVEGTVIAVDPVNGSFTILLPDGVTTQTIFLADGQYDHPIVQLLDSYFGYNLEAWAAALAAGETVVLNGTATQTTTIDPITGLPVTTFTLVNVGDEIAAYHDSGMGFGMLTKLYAMADAAGLPVATLVDQFRGAGEAEGIGMGQLFKLYGKPEVLGPGHVRQELGLAGNDKDKGEHGSCGAPPCGNDKPDKGEKGNKGGKKPK